MRTLDPSRCYNPAARFKPQWAYPTPQEARDEIFLIPFRFTMPGDGKLHQYFPIQLDDDVPWWYHGTFFPVIAISDGGTQPSLSRLTDPHGNPLSQGLMLSLGIWGVPDLVQQGAAGFPLEPAIECPPGSAIQIDFAVSTNATFAFFVHAGATAILEVDANVWGTAGNAATIQVANGAALSIAVVGQAITITINTGVSTFQDVADIINGTPAAKAVMLARLFGTNFAEVITAFGPSPLAGGTASTPVTIGGTLLGCKRFRECL